MADRFVDAAIDAGPDAAQQRRAQRGGIGQFGHLNRLLHDGSLDLHEELIARRAANGGDGGQVRHARVIEH